MPVYLICAGGDSRNGPVKIGYVGDGVILNRLAVMQSNNHVRLRLIQIVDGGPGVEAALHEFFAHLRLHGEWFTHCEEMEGDLGFPLCGEAKDWPQPWPIAQRSDPSLKRRKSNSRRALWKDPEYRKMQMSATGTKPDERA